MRNLRAFHLTKKPLHSDREVKRNKTYETIIGKRIEPLSANQNFVTVIAISLKYLITILQETTPETSCEYLIDTIS